MGRGLPRAWVGAAVCAALAAAWVGGAPVARAEETPGTEAAAGPAGPAEVHVGLQLVSVRDVDARTMTFYADFYLWQRFEAATWKEYQDRAAYEFMNGSPDVTEDRADERCKGEGEFRPGPQYRCTRVRGTFAFHPELHAYPFDTQELSIVVESPDEEALGYLVLLAALQRG